MMCQAKNECYLNAASLVHGCGKENIRPADDIVSEKVSDKEAAIGMGELRRRRQERLAGFPVHDDYRGYVLGTR